jgi:hypothetical protein
VVDGENSGPWIPAGLICIVGGAIGGGLKLAGAEIPVLDSLVVQLGLVVLGVLFLVAGAHLQPRLLVSMAVVALLLPVLSATLTDEGTGTTTTTSPVVSVPRTVASTTVGSDTTSAATSTVPVGCTIEVTHFGARLQRDPDHSSQTLSSIAEGTYEPSAVTTTEFAGRVEQWFQIEVEGRVGWTVDDPILLTKSPECP